MSSTSLFRNRRGGGGDGGDGVGFRGFESLRVDDDLDDKVLLDLSVLQPRLVRQELPGEEPALVSGVDVLLSVELLLQKPDGVRHRGAETQVRARGEADLQTHSRKGEINNGPT